MKPFACVAAVAWGLVVCGAAAAALVLINPDRLDISVGDAAMSVGVVIAAAALVIGGFVVAAATEG